MSRSARAAQASESGARRHRAGSAAFAFTLAIGLLSAAAPGCDSTRRVARGAEQALNPFASSTIAILRLDRHGPYLAVEFRSGRVPLVLLVAAERAACAQMMRPEAALTYRQHGNFGRFESGGEQCDAVGVASLAAWRDRQPRGARGGGLIPRASARFREIARDESFVIVRGRFPLAGRVGVPNSHDVVALLPNEAACERAIAAGIASLEFVPAGRQALRLVGDRGSCPVIGLALPLGPAERVD